MNKGSKLTNAEYLRLLNAQSERAWNAAYDEVKKAHGGQYPFDWWQRVMQPGGAFQVFMKRINRKDDKGFTIGHYDA